MEMVAGESLHAHLKATTQRRFTEEKAKRVIKQLLTILAYLHQRNVTHRDIKLENIIIDKRGVIKLIDFGFCCCSSPDIKLKIFCGTPSYMCPEIAMKREYLGPPTDIWASGILLFAMLCGQFPFRGANDKELYKKIGWGVFDYPEHLSSQAKMFMSKMLLVDPGSRVSADKLLQDPFLSGSQFQTSDQFLSTNESSGLNAYSKSLNNNSPKFDSVRNRFI
jgi:serine/threonine protein kinase